MQKLSNILWGLVLVTLGVVLGLNALGLTNIDIFFSGWWTLFIIVPCTINLFVDSHKVPNIVGILLGVCLLLVCQGVLSVELLWKLILPVVLVVGGFVMVFKGVLGQSIIADKVVKSGKRKKGRQYKTYVATLSEQEVNFRGEKFSGCNLEAVFGSIKCDLFGAEIEDGAVIIASNIFGGTTLYVPEDVEVKYESAGIFSGVTDKRKVRFDSNDDGDKTKRDHKVVYVEVTSTFGGLEIR